VTVVDDTDEPQVKPVLHGVIDRNRRGQFTRGNPGPPEHAKRKRGQKNLIPRTAREALQQAVERIGSDGAGRDGARGFLEKIGREDPLALAAIYARACIPVAKDGDDQPGAGGLVDVIINVIPVASGTYFVNETKYRLVSEASARLLSEFGDDGQPRPVREAIEPDPPPPADAASVSPEPPEPAPVPESSRVEVERGRARRRRREPWEQD
jgi:hypothetical protein